MPEAPAATPAPGGTGTVVYGLLRMAGVEVALPLADLREVVPCPDGFAALPVRAPGLLGAMLLRDAPVPVLDLGAHLGTGDRAGREDRDAGDRVVVIVAHGGRRAGLLAEAVRGIGQVPVADLRAVRSEGSPLLFSHTVRHPESGVVLSVLDVTAVLATPGVPVVLDTEAPSGGPAAASGPPLRREEERTLTLLRCDRQLLALDVEHVHTTLARATPRRSVLDGPVCRGVTDHAGREVAVLDPLALLGLGRLSQEGLDLGAGLVLDLGHGYVVLAVSAVLDIVRVPARGVLPVPPFSVHRPELLDGVVDVPGTGPVLVLAGGALRAEEGLATFAAVNTAHPGEPDGAVGASDAAGPRGGEPYLCYSIGVDVVTPLEQVVEILPHPAALIPTHVGEHVLGVFVHRDCAVPVVRLATLLGLPAVALGEDSCLLLVQVGDGQVGFAVDGLRGIDPLTWSERATDGSAPPQPRAGGAAGALRSASLVSTGGDRRLLPELDLEVLARGLGAEPGPAGVPAAVGSRAVPGAFSPPARTPMHQP